MTVKQVGQRILREMRLEFSLMILILGLVMFIEAMTQWFWENPPGFLRDIHAFVGAWSIWMAFVGLILLVAGLYYLWDSIAKRRELRELLETDSKQVFLRNQERIEYLAFVLPRSFERVVNEKRREFGLR